MNFFSRIESFISNLFTRYYNFFDKLVFPVALILSPIFFLGNFILVVFSSLILIPCSIINTIFNYVKSLFS